MNKFWQDFIIEMTGATQEEAAMIEDMMRSVYGTLNGLSRAQFQRDAKECYDAVQYMNTEEGAAYLAELDEEIFGECK